ncbi:NAD+ synthase [Cellulomonas sp. NS3]|uniref:NAD+ synthase n=1 Tax=Cellulomonas sp. NS3 TaxID=2973977 RepID=UPI0021616D87|nr:NAD+ synthase [Cellulomonas sp. NS3]
MTTLRVLLAQTTTRVGDLPGNAAALAAAVAAAEQACADVLVTPEMAVTGYPAEDLLAEPDFVGAAMDAVTDVAASTGRTVALLGSPWHVGRLPDAGGAGAHGWSTDALERPLRNVAAVAHRGRVVAAHAKSLLPTYSVLDDARHFAPGARRQSLYTVRTAEGPVTFGVLVCEDVWDPALAVEAARAGAQVLLVPNASPYHVGKPALRLARVTAAARASGVPIVYCNTVGGQDEVVFDGGSFVVDADGGLLAQARSFAADELVVDVPVRPRHEVARGAGPGRDAGLAWGTARVADPRTGASDVVDLGVTHTTRTPLAPPVVTPALDADAEVYAAIVTGFGDYCRRVGLPRVVLGLSGGIDSALAAVVAVDALGADAVWGVGMPGPYSSAGSVDDARELAANLGIRFDVVPISDAYAERHDALGPLLAEAAGAGRSPSGGVDPVAWENLQARLRGTTLMTIANATAALVCTTGNRSESAVGYFTLYGDSCGTAPNPLGDLLKTTVTRRDGSVLPGVYGLAEWRNAQAAAAGQVPPIPAATLTKPASAELAPDQRDTDSLPAYPVLDRLLLAFLEDHATAQELARTLVDEDGWDVGAAVATVNRVLALVDRSEFKRRQAPVRIKVSRLAFGRDRRMPMANHWSHARAVVPEREALPA